MRGSIRREALASQKKYILVSSLKKTRHEIFTKVLEREIKNLKDQVASLSTNMGKMMTKLLILEDKNCDVDYVLPKHTHGNEKDADKFECEICGFKCSKEA